MTSLIIQTQDHLTDSPQSKTITNINPAVKTADLLTFAQMTAALSSDSFVKATRVEQVDCSVTKPSLATNKWRFVYPNPEIIKYYDLSDHWEVSFKLSELTVKNFQLRLPCPIWSVSTQILDVQSTNNTDWGFSSIQWTGDKGPSWQQGMWYAVITCSTPLAACDITFKIKVLETEQYAGVDLPVTIHITED